MTRRNARIAMELIRIARLLTTKGVLEQGMVMPQALQSFIDTLMGDRKVEQVDLDVLLDGVDSHGSDYESREDSVMLKGPSASYRKGQDIMDYLFDEFDTQSFFSDRNNVEDITPIRLRCVLRDGTGRSVMIVKDLK